MRYSASEKFEIIELVEQSSLSIRRTLAPIGIPRSTFYDWYSRYQEGGIEALVDGKPRPRRIWNKIPDKIETAIINLALEEPDLSPRELAVNFTDTKGSFVSEATVYRLLKDHGLITSPAFILMKAADRFANPTTAPNQRPARGCHRYTVVNPDNPGITSPSCQNCRRRLRPSGGNSKSSPPA
jgi:putative transposase